MRMKKKALVVLASAILSTTLVANSASANDYTVKAGDTLWKIANVNSISVAQLKSWNQLTSDVIVPNQVLKVTASTETSPAPVSAPAASAPSATVYTVTLGDSLYRISAKFGVSIANLKTWNSLPTDTIFIGQKLKVAAAATVAPAPAPTPAPAAPSSSAATTHKVVSGDTLSKIAAKYGVSIANIKAWNNLPSDMIYVGQNLAINGTASAAPAPAPAPVVAGTKDVISIAKQYLGTPYVWGGSVPGGFDCSGFIYYVLNQAGTKIGRTNTTGYYNATVATSSPKVGDLVFFANTYKPGISHMGFYLGNSQFIHAGSNGGVQISSFASGYWKDKFHSFRNL